MAIVDKDRLAAIEAEIDAGFEAALGIRTIPKAVGREAALDVTESLLRGHGTPPDEGDAIRMYSLGLVNASSLFLRKLNQYGLDSQGAVPDDIDVRVRKCISACHYYNLVEDAFFSAWKGYATAEVPNASVREIRFTPTGTKLDARLRSFDGHDEESNRPQPEYVSPLKAGRMERSLIRTLERARPINGRTYEYEMEETIIEAFVAAEVKHLSDWIGEVPDIALGEFKFNDLITGWAVIRAAARLHQLVSFLLSRGQRGYIDSLPNPPALYRQKIFWKRMFDRMARPDLVFQALTFDPSSKSADLAITPVVEITSEYYGLIPSIALRAHVPRNLFVLLASRFQSEYSKFSLTREETLTSDFAGEFKHLTLGTAVKLPKFNGVQLPDIDLLISDGSRMVVAELKWQLSASSTREVVSRNDYLKKGYRQLIQIRDFLLQNPTYLSSRSLSSTATTPDMLSLVLLCKGHLGNEDVIEGEGVLMCDYGVFKKELREHGLESALELARNFNYLPVRGRDFQLVPSKVKFGDWRIVWTNFLPVELPADDETDMVEAYYQDGAEFIG